MQKLKTAAFALCLAVATAQAGISYTPVTEGATGGAQKLYNFLATNYGVKTVSGMMTGDVGSVTDIKTQVDVDTMYQKTGKYPVLVGFDFLFATGLNASNSWYQSYTNTALTLAKDLWNKGGIPAFTWHWKDPSDSVDQFYVNGHDTVTTFNFTKGFTTGTTTWDTTSATYKALVSDIDEIAAYFLQLQKDSVAAVFRPLHEASGAWFWWGTQGGAAYQALYNLVYDRMVKVDGVKNLVWVWNPEYATDTSWNPGSTKYDVISMDIYEAYDYTTKFVTGYKTLTTNFGSENKIFAVSENGPIPDVSTMHTNGTVWSWWMPWYQSWSGKFLDQTVDAVWKANMNDPCTITLDEMPGWDKYTISTTPVSACTVGYALGDLDSARNTVVEYPGDTASNGYLMVSLDYGTATTQDTAAKGNVVIDASGSLDFTGVSSISFNVKNSNTYAGIWFTLAFLGNANTGWTWAQPEGCWVNAGDSTTCTITLSTTSGEKVPSDVSLETFFNNIAKVYIEIFGTRYTGTVFFDDLVANTGDTLVSFDSAIKLSLEEGDGVVSYGIVGNGNSSMGIASETAIVFGNRLTMGGDALELTTAKSGNVSVELYGTNGARAVTLFNGELTAGTHSLSLSKVHSGYYIARVKGVNGMAAKPIFVK